MQHTVTSDTNVFSSGTLNTGNTFSQIFSTPGTFPYFCAFHGQAGGSGMSGTIIVTGPVTPPPPPPPPPTPTPAPAPEPPPAPTPTPPPPSGGGGGSSSGGGGSAYVPPPPSNTEVGSVSAAPANAQVALSWQNPESSDYVRTIIVRREGSAPTSLTDGQQIYEGTAEQFTDTKLENGQNYYYAIFTIDRNSQVSTPQTIQASPQAGITQTSQTPLSLTTRLVQYPGDPTVYVIENGLKKGIPSYDIYQRSFAARPIAIIPPTETYPDGPNLRFSSGALLKAQGPAIYLVLDNGDLYAFQSMEEFNRFGYRTSQVSSISDADLATYPRSAIAFLRYHGSSNFVKYANSATVYMIENNTKRPLTSPDVYFSYATDWNQVLIIPDDFVYTDGPILTFPDGMLLKGSGPTVYLTDNHTLRPFTSADAFLKLGYSWNQIREVRDSDLFLMPLGAGVE